MNRIYSNLVHTGRIDYLRFADNNVIINRRYIINIIGTDNITGGAFAYCFTVDDGLTDTSTPNHNAYEISIRVRVNDSCSMTANVILPFSKRRNVESRLSATVMIQVCRRYL